jgi:hypothetical protein
MVRQFKNDLTDQDSPTGTLVSGISAVDTSLTLDTGQGAKLPSTGDFTLRIGDELIKVGARTSDVCSSLTRGDESTTASIHAAGAEVNLVLTAAPLTEMLAEIIDLRTKVGSGADAPAANEVLKGTGVGTSAWSALTLGEITTALAYTPVNKAGDTMTGNLLINGANLSITKGNLGAAPALIFDVSATLPNGSGLVTTYRPFYLLGTVTETDIANPLQLVWAGISSGVDIGGVGAAAVVGTAHAATFDTVIKGCGDADNECAALYSQLAVDIGTGFTQTSGPCPGLWMADMKLAGPIAVQPNLFVGISLITNNHYNGNPTNGPSAGQVIVTQQGSVGSATHFAANTYPVQIGLGIMGAATHGNGQGFNTALRIGGTGGPWNIAASRFGTGIEVKDWESYGVYVSGRYAGASGYPLVVAPNIGNVGIGTLTPAALLHIVNATQASGPGILVGITQTTPNAGDTSDAALSLNYNLSGVSATNELVSRVFYLAATNTLTGGGAISNLRVANIIVATAASTTTAALAGLYIEAGTNNGTVTDGRAIHIASFPGTTKYGIYDQSGGAWRQEGANTQSLDIRTLTELTTIAAAATTDTTIQLPAAALVLAVSSRVTTQPPGTTTTDIGISGSTTRYGTGISTAGGTTNPGTLAGVLYNASAVSVRYTPNTSPSNNSGRIRTTIHYILITPPGS